MSRFLSFEDLARQNPESAQNAVVAILRMMLPDRYTRITLTQAELIAAMEFRLVGVTSVDGNSLTFTLEKKGRVL